MSPALLLFAAAALGEPAEPPPPEDKPTITLSITGDYSTLPDSDAEGDLDSASGGVGLSWSSGGVTIGGSLSRIEGSALPPDFEASSDGSGLAGTLFIGWMFGDYDLDLSISHAQQTLEGTSRISDDGPPAYAGREVSVDGETRSWSAYLGASRTFFGDGNWLRPHAGIGWNQTETEVVTALVGGGSGLRFDGDASGASISAGVETGAILSDWLSVFADISGIASSNEAANVFGLGGRTTRPYTSETGPDDEGGAWAELSAGFAIDMPADVSLSFVAGASAGREDDDVFASLSLSKSF